MVPGTIPTLFLDVCDRFRGRPGKTAYAHKAEGTWRHTSHDDLRRQVECFALGLLLEGVVPGERIGIASENRIEWPIANFAINTLGAIDVPVFQTLTARQEAQIFANCGASVIIVSNAFQLGKINKVRDELPSLRTIIVMNDDVETGPGIVRFSDVMRKGEASATADERERKFRTMAMRVQPDDLLTLIYTSGTTGTPKGVMLTHRNITSNIAGALAVLPVSDADIFLSYLPLCHSYERMAGFYCAFTTGASTYFAESIESVADNLREVRPTIMTSVPRLFERVRGRIIASVDKQSAVRRRIFHWAVDVGLRTLDADEAGRRSPLLAAQHVLADRLVFSSVRERMGGRLRFFVSGGAALAPDIGRFFQAMGIVILEGYGLTETSPVLCVTRPDDVAFGTVGKPLPNVEIRIADDGEILAWGPNIMRGYWQDDAATVDAIDPAGWIHTGDIGVIGDDANLRITDRKKHILVSSGGKNIAPQPIEQALLQSPLIDQVILIGDHREYCTALVVPDEDAVRALFTQGKLAASSREEMFASDELHRAIRSDITRLQQDLSKYERVRRFTVLPAPFTVENGMLTPTLKIKRKEVEKQYKDVIDAMYEESTTDE